jgi:LL-diaminopimelate aminotransferase
MVNFAASLRLSKLPPYLFAEIEKTVTQIVAKGVDIINLSIGDPDIMPPSDALEKLASLLGQDGIHRYSPTAGIAEFRQAIARWMKRRFGVELHPAKEICLGIGSKELLAHIPMALADPGDIVIIPEPGYPPYRSGTIFAIAQPHFMPLLEENGFLIDIDAIEDEVARKTKIMFINYPNNPTGAMATEEFFVKLVDFAHRYNIIIVSDLAYSEIYFDKPPISILQIDGAKEVAIEVHSLTKTFSMSGWRVAWVCGNQKLVDAVRAFKANVDSGQFMVIQKTGAFLLDNTEKYSAAVRQTYKRRRDIMVEGLRKLGWNVPLPLSTFYLWFKTPNNMPSMDFVNMLLEKTGIVLTPGAGFGDTCKDYVRLTLTASEERLKEALRRLEAIKI